MFRGVELVPLFLGSNPIAATFLSFELKVYNPLGVKIICKCFKAQRSKK